MLTAYLILAAWFWMIDMLAGYIADSPPRPLVAAILAAMWPFSMAFALLASAAIITRLRNPTPTEAADRERR